MKILSNKGPVGRQYPIKPEKAKPPRVTGQKIAITKPGSS
jgi:hypothetical protein